MRDVATMREKAQGWLGNLLGWGRRRQSLSAEKLYVKSLLSVGLNFFKIWWLMMLMDVLTPSLIAIIVMRRLNPWMRAEKLSAKIYLITFDITV